LCGDECGIERTNMRLGWRQNRTKLHTFSLDMIQFKPNVRGSKNKATIEWIVDVTAESNARLIPILNKAAF
jgi:hypothetical protein